MQWIVEGADAENGRDTSITVDADNRIHAEAVARQQGILVSSVRRASSPADALEAMFGPPLVDAEPPVQPPVKPVPAASSRKSKSVVRRDISTSSIMEGLAVPVDYRSPTGASSDVPAYLWLKSAGIVLGVLATIAYLAGACIVVYTLLTFFSAPRLFDLSMIISVLMALIGAAMPVVAGAILHALSAGCFVLRDFAQRSARMDNKG
jgi:hypothetical protein